MYNIDILEEKTQDPKIGLENLFFASFQFRYYTSIIKNARLFTYSLFYLNLRYEVCFLDKISLTNCLYKR